jgi:hypothetical protein
VFNNLDIVIGILTSLCCHKTPYGNIVFMFKTLLSSSNSDGGGLVGASLVEQPSYRDSLYLNPHWIFNKY